MPTTCPKCGGVIPQDDINVAKDIAFCRKCDKGFPLSDIVMDTPVGPVDLASPPRGAWYRDEGGTVSLGASTRSGTGAFFLFFALFWNSITWVFVVVFVTEAIRPGTIPMKSSSGHPMPTAFGLLFMVPFVLVGLGTGAAAMLGIFGRVEATVRAGEHCQVFVGVGNIGWRRPFDAASVTGVSIRPSGWTQNGRQQMAICLDGPGLKFGGFLTDERRAFVAAALRKVLG